MTTVPVTLRAFLLPLADALQHAGWQVDALTGFDDAEEGRPEPSTPAAGDKQQNRNWQASFTAIHRVRWTRSATSLIRYPQLAARIRRLVRSQQYQVVHTHTPIASLVTRLALRKVSGVRIIYTAHGFHFYRLQPSGKQGSGGQGQLKGRLYQIIERLAARYTDVLVVMNNEDEIAAQQMAAAVPRCTVVRIDGVGIDVAAYSAAELSPQRVSDLRARHQLAADCFVVSTIAEMNHNKRHQLLLAAAQQLQDSHPQLRWLFIGSGPLEAPLREYVHNRHLPVSFAGQVSRQQLRELLALTDLGILVSQREGLPRSLMEFSAAGIPIAGTTTRGIVDEVLDGRALAAAATPAAIAEVVARLADKPQLAAELAEKQQQHAAKHYTLDVIIPQYLKLYSL